MTDPAIVVDGIELVLDHQSYVPFYQQIVEQIRPFKSCVPRGCWSSKKGSAP